MWLRDGIIQLGKIKVLGYVNQAQQTETNSATSKMINYLLRMRSAER